MLTTRSNRIDPSLIPAERIAEVADAFARPGHVALIDSTGHRTELPEALFHHFARIVRLVSEKKAVVLIPEEETFTTQAAANYLGMSRQHLVNLLEQGNIPHHKVGSHRRVTFRDLIAYEKHRDRARRESLDRLSKAVDAAGKYESDYAGKK